MGSKASAACVRRDTIWHLARVLGKRFTFSLPVHFEVVASKDDCGRWVQQQCGTCRGGHRDDGGWAISGFSPGSLGLPGEAARQAGSLGQARR